MCFAASEASQRRGTQSSRRAPSREPRPALGIRRPSSELCLRLCFNSVYLYSISKACPKGSETSKRGHSGDLGTLKKFSMQVKGNCFFASCHPASGTLSQKQQQGSRYREPLPQARRTPQVHQRSNFTRCAAGEHKPWKTQGRHGTAVIPPPENEEQVGSLCYTVH